MSIFSKIKDALSEEHAAQPEVKPMAEKKQQQPRPSLQEVRQRLRVLEGRKESSVTVDLYQQALQQLQENRNMDLTGLTSITITGSVDGGIRITGTRTAAGSFAYTPPVPGGKEWQEALPKELQQELEQYQRWAKEYAQETGGGFVPLTSIQIPVRPGEMPIQAMARFVADPNSATPPAPQNQQQFVQQADGSVVPQEGQQPPPTATQSQSERRRR